MTSVGSYSSRVHPGRAVRLTPLRWMGLALCALSIVALTQHGLDLTFSPALQTVLDRYDQALRLLLALPDQWARNAAAGLSSHFGRSVEMPPTWMHYFVVLALLFLADARKQILQLEVGDRTTNSLLGGISAFVGLLLAFACSLAAAAVWEAPHANWAVLLPLVVLLGAHLLFWSINLIRDAVRFGWTIHFMDFFGEDVHIGLAMGLIGVGAIALSPQIDIGGLRQTLPALISIGLYTVAFALVFVARFLLDWAVFGRVRSYSTLLEDPEGRTGINFVIALTLAGAFVFLDALAFQ